MKIKVYQSETDEYVDMNSIGKLKYIGESFGVEGLTNNNVYDVVEVLNDDLIRVVDDSGEDYLYSISNPRPIDNSSKGGKWEREEGSLNMKCPVCNNEVDMFDICDNCNYQNSGPKENLDGPTGPNKMTLREAREAYKKGEKII